MFYLIWLNVDINKLYEHSQNSRISLNYLRIIPLTNIHNKIPEMNLFENV